MTISHEHDLLPCSVRGSHHFKRVTRQCHNPFILKQTTLLYNHPVSFSTMSVIVIRISSSDICSGLRGRLLTSYTHLDMHIWIPAHKGGSKLIAVLA